MKTVFERDSNLIANGLAEHLSSSLGNAQTLLRVYGIDGISVDEMIAGLVKFVANFLVVCAPDGRENEMLDLFGDAFGEMAAGIVEVNIEINNEQQ